MDALNSGIAFDKPITFKAKDVFVICLKNEEQLYAYQYKGKKWTVYHHYDVFDLMNKYEEIRTGVIKPGQ